jgi:hypothetical protein
MVCDPRQEIGWITEEESGDRVDLLRVPVALMRSLRGGERAPSPALLLSNRTVEGPVRFLLRHNEFATNARSFRTCRSHRKGFVPTAEPLLSCAAGNAAVGERWH